MTMSRSQRIVSSLRAAALMGAVLAVLVALALTVARRSAGAQSTAKPMRVLFIGNSYTYVNNLPGVLIDMAKAAHAPAISGRSTD